MNKVMTWLEKSRYQWYRREYERASDYAFWGLVGVAILMLPTSLLISKLCNTMECQTTFAIIFGILFGIGICIMMGAKTVDRHEKNLHSKGRRGTPKSA